MEPETTTSALLQQKARLADEKQQLQNAARFNLSIGILLSIFTVICIIVTFIFLHTNQTNAPIADASTQTLYSMIGGFLLVILSQVVSFFFLRLYVSNQWDVKYFSNEISNVESRLQAYITARDHNDGFALGRLINQLAQTERNFVLKNGERVVFGAEPPAIKDMSASLAEIAEAIKNVKRP